ncbi:hypothetical protein A1O7_06036 [Cladophialophora yegresii CBS 114405]|uniref:Xylanolytic transcriptional activator regulatory domain-containing protein n=1 Tax=Cladophialophora yegresii CBS 114405 TaxID=1182544 RepID=W9WJD7_9EURO|nr:uncharacterized protein A1O7_06036 [Cladophialophora yegresii CBS 114405]EXJ58609.1 hypothetical protein A1O7_06036 [Cladophialophora yegresii CBS 114405]
MAVTLGQDLGLDMKLASCETRRQRMLKRLWWCCFMRDQFVALMMWTPPQLGARHRHLPMLELSDFELQDGSAAATNGRHEWDFLSNRTTRIHLAILCIAKAKLCVCINQILQARYKTLRYENCDNMTTILVPMHSHSSPFEILELDRQLREWHYDVSGNGGFDLRDPANSATTGKLDATLMHRAHLKLLFLAALIALHRPQALNTTSTLSTTYRQLSREKLHDAADEIAHIAISIKDLHMGTHLNPNGLNLLLPIMLAHLQDVQPLIEHRRCSRQDKYHDSMQALDTLGDLADPEVFLPSKLETSFLKFNILPSREYNIPASIGFQRVNYDSLCITPSRIVSTLSQLGAVTHSELEMLAGMGGDRKHIPRTTNSDDDTRVSLTLASSANALASQCINRTCGWRHGFHTGEIVTAPAVQSFSTVVNQSEDTSIEKHFDWRLKHEASRAAKHRRECLLDRCVSGVDLEDLPFDG